MDQGATVQLLPSSEPASGMDALAGVGVDVASLVAVGTGVDCQPGLLVVLHDDGQIDGSQSLSCPRPDQFSAGIPDLLIVFQPHLVLP